MWCTNITRQRLARTDQWGKRVPDKRIVKTDGEREESAVQRPHRLSTFSLHRCAFLQHSTCTQLNALDTTREAVMVSYASACVDRAHGTIELEIIAQTGRRSRVAAYSWAPSKLPLRARLRLLRTHVSRHPPRWPGRHAICIGRLAIAPRHTTQLPYRPSHRTIPHALMASEHRRSHGRCLCRDAEA